MEEQKRSCRPGISLQWQEMGKEFPHTQTLGTTWVFGSIPLRELLLWVFFRIYLALKYLKFFLGSPVKDCKIEKFFTDISSREHLYCWGEKKLFCALLTFMVIVSFSSPNHQKHMFISISIISISCIQSRNNPNVINLCAVQKETAHSLP